jgi:SAM-dependent methyltransferase
MAEGVNEPNTASSGGGLSDELLRATSEYWGARAIELGESRDHWEGHPLVEAAMASRRGARSLTDCLVDHLPPGARRGVGLGVGKASFELDLLKRGAIRELDLYDAGQTLLESAREAAVTAGIAEQVSFHVADLNMLDLEEDAYDLVIWLNSLHHVVALDRVLEQCHQALRPGGLFFAHEYVGPDRFAFPEEHVDLARAIYRTLDPALRCPWPELPVPDPRAVAAADPTEAVRSTEIVDTVRARFANVHVVSYEACLTLIIWYGLNHDALFETSQGFDLVRWLLEVDSHMIRTKRLWTYQALLLAIK